VKRREFITLRGGTAAAWPAVAGARQPAMPVIGYLGARSLETDRCLWLSSIGASEKPAVEGRNGGV
jgi:putative ABC transport system substrate-binding protein